MPVTRLPVDPLRPPGRRGVSLPAAPAGLLRRALLPAVAVTLSLSVSPDPARAGGFAPVAERARFVDLVRDRALRIALYGLALKVHDDGRISGSAMGRPVSGQWQWRDGYFCREMTWGTRPIAPNCQLVEVRGREMRFTTDRGKGQGATFRLE